MTTKLPNNYPKEHIEHIPGVSIIKQGGPTTMLTEKKVQILDTLNQRVPLINQGG